MTCDAAGGDHDAGGAAPDAAAVADALAPAGLAVTGWVIAGAEAEVEGAPRGTVALALAGPGGPAMWAAFETAPERADGAPDPLDRWSRRVIGRAACALGAKAVFPFAGPPWRPFIAWAMAAEGAVASPVGMAATPARGLMASWRGALAFRHVPDGARAAGDAPGAPCAGCARPCATACPVDAFAAGRFDPVACRAHLSRPEGAACRTGGCLARRACPVSTPLPAAQQAFHLAAFHRSDPAGA